MKSYLDLIPVSAGVHRRQNRMTRICIVLAVALVAVIFGMADMAIRSQRQLAIKTDGSWHATFSGLTKEQASLLEARPEVELIAGYDVANYRLDEGYQIEGTPAAICGFDKSFLEMMPFMEIVEGDFPAGDNGAVFTQSVRQRLGLSVGDAVALTLPEGQILNLTASGFTGDTSMLTQYDAFGVFVSRAGFERIVSGEQKSGAKEAQSDPANGGMLQQTAVAAGQYYVGFRKNCNIQKTLADIRIQFGLEEKQIGQNARLLGLMGQSSDPFMQQLYMTAAVLAVLVTISGVLMITGSLNSNVAQRTGFFGMLRCLGATPAQVSRFVRQEALFWCRTAIPAGLLIGLVVVWILCAMLRAASPTYFGDMPVWGFSLPGLLAGTLIGLITVLLAARSLAKKASRVSPLTAVSGNAGTVQEAKRAAGTRSWHVETALGIHHAMGNRKNFVLMVSSFAFSIILFLAFWSSLDFMNHAITPLRPYTPDVSIVSEDNTCSIPVQLQQTLEADPAVKKAFGRSFAYRVPVLMDGEEKTVNLISYEKYQFEWAQDMLLEGSIRDVEDGKAVMTVYTVADANPVHTGSIVSMETPEGTKELPVSALLSWNPLDREEGVETVICSQALFQRLTGQDGYTIIDVQLNSKATDEDAARIRKLGGGGTVFSDKRMSNREVKGTYYAYVIFLYGFLIVITLITVCNIVNSMGMSVSARIRQYGAMRAVGMGDGQLIKMVSAEAVTYTVFGALLGCLAGLWINKLLYGFLVTYRWGDPWYVPVRAIGIILAVMVASVVLAVWEPAKRIKALSIVDTIGDGT